MNNGSASGSKQFPYPGISTTSDGAGAVTWVETHITQAACAYPITSSTTMGTGYQTEVANGKKNLWGDTLVFVQPESEHSAASTCEGFALAGGRVTNFTSGQGLVLMKEVLYTISGKRLPAVFHIGARAMTSHSLNVHCGHDDVMAVADTGWGILFARNAQEAGDLALICRRIAEETDTPFLNVQDGFLTTHTIENVRLPETELMSKFVKDPNDRIRCMFDPRNPLMSGVVQNQDAYMKGKIAQRDFYDRIPAVVASVFDEFYTLTGRRYRVVDGYRMEDAEYAIVGMGGMMETAEAAVDYMREEMGLKIGAVHVTCFAPFPATELVEMLKGVKAFTVVERMDNPLAQSNPLVQAIKAAFADALIGNSFGSKGEFKDPKMSGIPRIRASSAGLGSRDVRPVRFIASRRTCSRRPPASTRRWASSTRSRSTSPSTPMSVPTARSRCAVTRSVASDRSRPTSSSPRSSASCSTCTSRPTRSTAPRRRVSRPPTTSRWPRSISGPIAS